MKQFEEFNEEELRQMEEQLRSFGTPYSADEPDERYFANFRVRLMDRIDANSAPAKQSVIAQIISWFGVSPMRGLAMGMAVVIIALGSIWMLRAPQAPRLAVTAPDVASPNNSTLPTQPVVTTPSVATPRVDAPKNVAAIETPAAPTTPIEVPGISAKTAVDELFAEVDSDTTTTETATLSGGADDPVDLTTLSNDELLAVLDDISK